MFVTRVFKMREQPKVLLFGNRAEISAVAVFNKEWRSAAPACSQPPHGANDFSVAARTKDSKGVSTLPQLLQLRYLTDSHFPTSDNDRV